MNIDKVGISSIDAGALRSTTAANINSDKETGAFSDKSETIQKAMNTQAVSFKPVVTTTNQITFNADGSIVADRRNMTINGGKVQFGKPVSVTLPQDSNLSPAEQKEKYITEMLSNTKNIANCVFMVKDADGKHHQITIKKDKNNPYKVTVLTQSEGDKKPAAKEEFNFNSAIGSSDNAMKTAIKKALDDYGTDNVLQLAVSNLD